MGIYLNPPIQRFEEAIKSDIYVDKTGMISELNKVIGTKQKYISVSRPRRFGKTMAADMICAYYGAIESRSLFEDKVVASESPNEWDDELGKYNVIRIVMTDFVKKDKSVADAIKLITARIISELREEFPNVEYDSEDLFYSLDKLYLKEKTQFVIVIDEWDAIFRIRKDDKEGQNLYLDFLRDWFKDKSYIALAYMTGILPIKKYGEHSALNMFDEYSMLYPMQFAKYTGFTTEEVEGLCHEYKMDIEEVEKWYDGYTVADSIPLDKRELYRAGEYERHKIAIYSPLSVVQAMRTGIIGNYWNNTETYEALAEYIRKDFDGLKEYTGILMNNGRMKINISKYQNDMTTFKSKDDVLALLIHLGYLGYDSETEEVFIPNREIFEVFKDSTSDDPQWQEPIEAMTKSIELLDAIWNCDEKTVADIIEWTHDRTDNKSYNSELSLSHTLQYALYAGQQYYTEFKEVDSGKGYADLVYIPSPKHTDKPLLLIELKNGKSPQEAIDQILSRNYSDRLEHYKGNMLIIGISYDADARNVDEGYKKHFCRIVRGGGLFDDKLATLEMSALNCNFS
ncbi:PD-(D/E)XK nuclease superfamily protein [Pseudobutyrivibrio sp. ACV-2]|uniref:AAA family ATPase n=1 Tax=Pseudobutyrivibrio sp. ACV-2 TaxID=1520801 RepID=UPI00089958E2|nr:AAA family ATPase [Pseudobutyrivibrio sp. ACV-2]SEB00696.1 PD-(D/E)XK nuclease superfamily protein [Pseudobutyrivibrio sp. ACV-2]